MVERKAKKRRDLKDAFTGKLTVSFMAIAIILALLNGCTEKSIGQGEKPADNLVSEPKSLKESEIKKAEGLIKLSAAKWLEGSQCGEYGKECCDQKNCRSRAGLACKEFGTLGKNLCVCENENEEYFHNANKCSEKRSKREVELFEKACGNAGQKPCEVNDLNAGLACNEVESQLFLNKQNQGFSALNPVCGSCGQENQPCCNFKQANLVYRTCYGENFCTSENICVGQENFCREEYGISDKKVKICSPTSVSESARIQTVELKIGEKIVYNGFEYTLTLLKKDEAAFDLIGPGAACVAGASGNKFPCSYKVQDLNQENLDLEKITGIKLFITAITDNSADVSIADSKKKTCLSRSIQAAPSLCNPALCTRDNDVACCYSSGRVWSDNKCVMACDQITCSKQVDHCSPSNCNEFNDADTCMGKGNCWINNACFFAGQDEPTRAKGALKRICDPKTNQQGWTSVHTDILDKKSKCKPYILNNLPGEDTIDLIVIPENLFDPKRQLIALLPKVLSYNKEANGIFSVSPLYENREKFNVFYLDENAKVCDFAISSLRQPFLEICPLLLPFYKKAIEDCPKVDYVLVLADFKAIGEDYAYDTSRVSIMDIRHEPEVAAHEFMHLLGLIDEYAVKKGGQPNLDADEIIHSVNCDISPGCSKWASLASDPILKAKGAACIPQCNKNPNAFKPSENSIMNQPLLMDDTTGKTLNAPSYIHVKKVLERVK